MKIYTEEEYLMAIIDGKIELTCSGQGCHHQTVKYYLSIHKGSYSYTCPICAYGEAGGLDEKVSERLQTYITTGKFPKEPKEKVDFT